MTEMKLFTVEFDHPDGEESLWNIIAENPENAARQYLTAALEERITVDEGDIRNAGYLKVTRIVAFGGDAIAGIIDWENTGYHEIQAGPLLDELQAAKLPEPG